MMPLTVILIYIAVVSFLIYTFKNKKPLKWSEVLNSIPFNQYLKAIIYHNAEDVFRISENQQQNKKIPGPIILPFLGTKWQTIKMNKLHEYYQHLNQMYGDIVLEMNAGTPVISLFSRDDIEKVLEYPSKYPFRPPTEIISFYRRTKKERYASCGLVNAQGTEWFKLRSKLTPKTLESKKVLSVFCPDLNEICDDFVNVIRKNRNPADNILSNFESSMKMMNLEAACTLILGRRNLLQQTTDKNLKVLSEATKHILEIYRDSYYGNGLWKYFPTKTYKDYVRYEEKVYDIVYDIIMNSLNENELFAQDSDNLTILSKIIKSEGLDKRDKISGIIDFISASTVGVLTNVFLLYYLSSNPEVQEKIYQESLTMKEEINFDDIKSNAHYTRAAIHESFRISPIAFCIARILEEDFTLSGYHIKAGSIVLCQNYVACRKEENFERPTEFIPERWLNEKGEMCINKRKASSIVVPFGVGKRACPGKKFSEIELIILVIKLIRNFKIEYCSPFEEVFEFVLAPKGPIAIKFTDR